MRKIWYAVTGLKIEQIPCQGMRESSHHPGGKTSPWLKASKKTRTSDPQLQGTV